MFTSKHNIATQVLKLSDNEKGSALKLPDLLKTIEVALHELLNPECIDINLSDGLTIPQDARLYYFDGLVPEKFNEVSRLLLPVKPIELPRNMGVFHVSKENEMDSQFIPIEKSQLGLLKESNLLSYLHDATTYALIGNYIVFNKDLTAEKDVKLMIGLILNDISSYDNLTPFFIPDHLEGKIIESCLKILASGKQKNEKVINNNKSKDVPKLASYALKHVFWGKIDPTKNLTKTNCNSWAKEYGFSHNTLLTSFDNQSKKEGRKPEGYNKNHIIPFFKRFDDAVKMLQTVSPEAFKVASQELELLKIQYEDYLK